MSRKLQREEWRHLLREGRASEGAVARWMDGWLGEWMDGRLKTDGRRREGRGNFE
jgi:hypothetical protein